MSEAVDDVKKTPLRPRQKWTMGLLGIIILASGFVLGASTAFFMLQNRVVHDPRPPQGDRLKGMAVKYHLSPEQQSQLETLFKQQYEKSMEMRSRFFEVMKENGEQMVAQMKAILTPEQFTLWEKDFKKQTERFKRRGRGDSRRWGGPRRGPGPDGSPRRGPGPRGHDPNRQHGPREERNPNRIAEPNEG